MGQIAEDMLDGTMCQSCGSLNDELIAHMEKHAPGGGRVDVPWHPPGYPITCAACRRENKAIARAKAKMRGNV